MSMIYNKRNLRSVLRRVLSESSGLPNHIEKDVERQYEQSLSDVEPGWLVEIENDPGLIEAVKEFLGLRYGLDSYSDYMEEEDGDIYMIYSYGDDDPSDPELV